MRTRRTGQQALRGEEHLLPAMTQIACNYYLASFLEPQTIWPRVSPVQWPHGIALPPIPADLGEDWRAVVAALPRAAGEWTGKVDGDDESGDV